MKFIRTTMAALCVSLGVLSWTGVARATCPDSKDPKCQDQKTVEVDIKDGMNRDSVRAVTKTVPKLQFVIDDGKAKTKWNATWNLADGDDAPLVINLTKVIDDGNASVVTAAKEAGATPQQIQQVVSQVEKATKEQLAQRQVVQSMPPSTQTQSTREDAIKAAADACSKKGGAYNEQEKDPAKACVIVASRKADLTAESAQPAAQTQTKQGPTVQTTPLGDTSSVVAGGAGGARTNLGRTQVSDSIVQTKTQDQTQTKVAETKVPDQVKTADPSLLDVQTKLSAAHETLTRAIEDERKKPGGGDPARLGQLDTALKQVDANNVSLGSIINPATQSTARVTQQVTEGDRKPSDQGTGRIQAQDGGQREVARTGAATSEPQPDSKGWCSVGGKTSLAMTSDGTIVESADGGQTTIHRYGGLVDGKQVDLDSLGKSYQDARVRSGGASEIDARGERDLRKIHWLGLTYVVGGADFVVRKASCGFMEYAWRKGLKRAGQAIGNQFKHGHLVHKIVHLPVLFADELIPGKGKRGGFFKNLFICWPSYPFRKGIYQPIRNSGERAALRERIENGEDDLADLLAAAEDAGLLAKDGSDRSKYLTTETDDQGNTTVKPNYEGIWFDTKEAPRRSRGGFCTKGTGEKPGHPEMAQAISNFYGKDSDRSTDTAKVRSADDAVSRAMGRRESAKRQLATQPAPAADQSAEMPD